MSTQHHEERYFLLPHEDGTTLIMNNSMRLKEPEIIVLRKHEEVVSHGGEETLNQYLDFFPGEAKLKVALFEEMLRTMPAWSESAEPWYRELFRMATTGFNPDKNLRTAQEILVLEWLLLTVSEPKIRQLHESSFEALLELVGERSPIPSKAFLLEYSAAKTNEVSYAFLCAHPGEVLSLMYNFGEAGHGRCFSRALSPSIQRLLSLPSFPLWGEVCPRYRCLLLVEFLSHPGVVPVQELRERCSYSGLLLNPGLHKIEDPTQARVMAVLLFDNLAARPSKSPGPLLVAGVWLVTVAHALYAIYRMWF